MPEIKSTTSVNINTRYNKKSNRPSFMAETPLQKAKVEAKKICAYTAGKYVQGNYYIDAYHGVQAYGLLVGLCEIKNTPYYLVLDIDRNIQLASVQQEIKTIPAPLPMEFSILDWLKWHETQFLVEKVETFIKEKDAKLISNNIIVNYQRQFPKAENKDNKGNKKFNKSNNKKNASK